jgi:hypothetical protein
MMNKEARRRGIPRPALFHLADFAPQRKPSVLAERNLWFVDFPNLLRCRRPPPTGPADFWDGERLFETNISRVFLWRPRYLNGIV